MKTAAVIVAAGRGTRAGGGLPKQWREISGRPVACWTLRAFSKLDRLVMVIHPDDAALARDLCVDFDVMFVTGSEDRAGSVRAGLDALTEDPPDLVLIHDVARPCVSAEIIANVIAALAHTGGAAPALAVTDALWTGDQGVVTGTRDRMGVFRAQTPQGFRYPEICAAHAVHPGGAADDVEVARAAGMDVAIVQGEETNLKITGPADFARAAAILERSMTVRLGNGYDVHAFEEGDHVTLCGVAIPFNKSLKGHSDADVGMHAVTDAIYGALAQGDIGRHFPPSDPQWKGAPSHIFLRHACDLAREKGYDIGNIDCTLVCELPKIGPHSDAMMLKMAEIMQVRPDQVSIKATTSERLGFTGREEGIAALATAVLVQK